MTWSSRVVWASPVLVSAFAASLAAQSTVRVNIAFDGAQANGTSGSPTLGAGASVIAFSSTATNLVPSDLNGAQDVFIRDRLASTTTRASVGLGGQESDGVSGYPSISTDGAFVAFESTSTNLVSGDSNGAGDVFVYERTTGITRRASVSGTGVQGNGTSQRPSISSDGRFVAFESSASNLAPTDTNTARDVFVRDMLLGTTTHASFSPGGTQQAYSTRAAISGNGQAVAYDSISGSGAYEAFRRDLVGSSTQLVSLAPVGATSLGGDSWDASVSLDGRFVAFDSNSFAFPSEPGGMRHVYLHDTSLGVTRRVSIDWEQTSGNATSSNSSISTDGRWIAFASTATNLVLGDSNSVQDVFVHDSLRTFTFRASVTAAGLQGNGSSSNPILASDGRSVAFVSVASNLVNGDTNGVADIFVVDICTASVSTYCTAGISVHGCVPWISGDGTPSSTSASGFDVVVSGLDGDRYGTIFYGFYPTSTPWAPSSPSFRCVASPVQRTGVTDSAGTAGQCDGELRLDFNAWIHANSGALGSPFVSGQVFYAQGWFRDPAAPMGTNLSNGIRFMLCD